MRTWLMVNILLMACAAAQAQDSAALISDPFVETYQPEVSVSGNIIVGVMTATAVSAMLDDRIAVHSAGVAENTVCLRVSSRDGIYTSRNIYALPEGADGSVLLPYRSRLADIVRAYGADEIAMAATAGECDSGSAEYFLLSAADEPAATEIVIYLNSFGATDVFYQLDADAVPCEYISEGRRTTFDFICRLSAVEVDEAVPLTIIRERFGREQPSIDLKIIGARR